MRQAAITILARIQLWAMGHKFPGSAALVCALDRAMGRLEVCPAAPAAGAGE